MFNWKKKKKHLSRNDFINSVDSNKIWSKSLNLPEINELLEYLKNKISKYDFEIDKNFIMNSRRKRLYSMIKERMFKNDETVNDYALESLFNLWEFVNDEYPGDFISIAEELKLSIKELVIMDNEYRKKGIICIQERDIILEIIYVIKNFIIQNT